MLRVGLTGELGSGKSTVARLLADRGALVLSSDEMGRALMQPGQSVYDAIVAQFGTDVVLPNGQLDRARLARLAFDPEWPRIEELNAIVHPAVLAEQETLITAIARTQPDAMVVVESALIFSTKHAGGDEPWRKRFDRIIVVTAPDQVKVERFVQRVTEGRQLSPDEWTAVEADARARLAAQRIFLDFSRDCIVIQNAADLNTLAHRTEEVFRQLRGEGDDVQVRGASL